MDLTDPENRGKSRNTRFINRVFTSAEQQQISLASDPDAALWTLWAGKETAYKIARKSHPEAPAIPRLYEVLPSLEEGDASDMDSSVRHGQDSGRGSAYFTVHTHGKTIHIRSFMTGDYVHCIGTTDSSVSLDDILWEVRRIDPAPQDPLHYESRCGRNALKNHLSDCISQGAEDIEIQRMNGLPPYVYIQGEKTEDIDISLSHDGRFVAHAFVMNEGEFETPVNPEAQPSMSCVQSG